MSWSTIAYGAAASAVGAVLLVAATTRPRRPVVILTAAVGSMLGPLAWNGILRATRADSFFVDAPVPAFPVSWQDAGSGVFAYAVTASCLASAHCARDPVGPWP